MSQSDMVIADQPGASFLADLNAVIAALVTNSGGATEPATTYANQPWADTTSGIFKIRNDANSAWISVFVLSTGAPVAGVAAGAITSSGLTQATSRMLGRSTEGTGAVEEISLASTLELLAGVLGVKDASITGAKLTGAQTGSAPIYGARAWARFNGLTTGTNAPTAGGNVATIQRTAVGVYVVTFTTAMPDANYAVFGTASTTTTSNSRGGIVQPVDGTFTVNGFTFITPWNADNGSAGAVVDFLAVSFSVIR